MRIGLLLAAVALAQAGELHDAARSCDGDRMRQVLSTRPPLNGTDSDGMTALHVAVDARRRECVWLLLEAGADRDVRDRQGRTATDRAEGFADPVERNVFVYMLKNFSVTGAGGEKGPKPWSLEHAAMHRQTSVTRMLLAMGADPNTVGTGGTTPLADAALKGDLEGVRLLLAHGARPDVVSRAGTQPIHDAALGDNAEVVRELVKRGADVGARTRDEGQTALHVAASVGRLKSLEALVELGADLTARDSAGRTPLETAERAGLTDVVALLKRAGATR